MRWILNMHRSKVWISTAIIVKTWSNMRGSIHHDSLDMLVEVKDAAVEKLERAYP